MSISKRQRCRGGQHLRVKWWLRLRDDRPGKFEIRESIRHCIDISADSHTCTIRHCIDISADSHTCTILILVNQTLRDQKYTSQSPNGPYDRPLRKVVKVAPPHRRRQPSKSIQRNSRNERHNCVEQEDQREGQEDASSLQVQKVPVSRGMIILQCHLPKEELILLREGTR
jgi:hypothetical protein